MDFLKNEVNWLYLDFNSYFATIEQQTRPLIRHRPIAVVPSLTKYTCAIAASYEAKRLGIKTGTMIFEAKKVCPNLICVKADHEKYINYHHKLVSEIDLLKVVENSNVLLLFRTWSPNPKFKICIPIPE